MLDDSFIIRYKDIPFAVSVNCNDKMSVEPHNHNEFEILYIKEGSSTVRINNEQYSARSGDIILINPLEIHSIAVDRSTRYCELCLCFDCSLITNDELAQSLKAETARALHHIKSTHECSSHLTDMTEAAYTAFESSGKTACMEIRSYITLIFAHLCKNSLIANTEAQMKKSLFCTNVLKFISENYRDDITSKDAANEFSYNHSYFCRAFKSNFGKSFSDYLAMYRISVSRRLLEEGKGSISHIATECGFNSPAYFSRSFKKHLGILPSEYVSV